MSGWLLPARLDVGRFQYGPHWSQTWPSEVPGPVGCLVSGLGPRAPPSTCSHSWAPSSAVVIGEVMSEFLPSSSSWDSSHSCLRARSPVQVQASSSSLCLSVESRSLLDSVPTLYSTWTLYCGQSPLVAPSRIRSRSPVLKGCHSHSRSRLRSHRSPAVSAGSLGGGVGWGGGCCLGSPLVGPSLF